MLGMARSLLVYRLTGSVALLGIASVTNFLPLIFLSPLGGALADRLQKKYVVLAGQLSSIVMALLVAIPLSTGYLSPENHASWWVLIASYVLDGIGIGLTGPSYQAIVREIVTADHVMNAVALNSLGQNVIRFAAPLATGFLISSLGFTEVLFVVAGLFLLGNVFILLIPAASLEYQGEVGKRRSWSEIQRGLSYVRSRPDLAIVLGFLFLAVLLSMPYGSLMPVFADDVLKVGERGMGILISVSGVGAMLVSLMLASMSNRRRGAVMLAGSLLLGLTLVVFSFSKSWYLSLFMIFFIGMGDTVRMTVGNALLLYYSDHEYWGRVMSIGAASFGLSSLGVVLASFVAQKVGVSWAVGGLAAMLCVVTVLTLGLVSPLT